MFLHKRKENEIRGAFRKYIEKGYKVIEITEPDEGDSIIIAIKPRDEKQLLRLLAPYIRATTETDY